MNKQQIVQTIAKKHGLTKAAAEGVLNTTLETITSSVKKGNEVRLIGFGTFTKAKRKARVGRNPQTGAQLKIPASFVPKFRPGSDFKSLVR